MSYHFDCLLVLLRSYLIALFPFLNKNKIDLNQVPYIRPIYDAGMWLHDLFNCRLGGWRFDANLGRDSFLRLVYSLSSSSHIFSNMLYVTKYF